MTQSKYAKILLDLKCVLVSPNNPFKYASGLMGPIYCDNRTLLSHVNEREKVIEGFLRVIRDNDLIFDVVAGVATAGIAHAALLAQALRKPMIYVRSKPKGHGKQNMIEGRYQKGQRILVIEDLVNQGKSVVAAIQALQEEDLTVVGCMSIVDYEMDNARKAFEEVGTRNYPLTTLSEIAKEAFALKEITSEGLDLLKSWNEDPVAWSKKNSK